VGRPDLETGTTPYEGDVLPLN